MIDINKYPSIIDEVYKDNDKAKDVLLRHSFPIAKKSLLINENKQLKLDEEFLFEGSMLHDIGIIKVNAPSIYCYGDKPYAVHGVVGAELLKGTKYEKYMGVCRNHCGVGLRKDEVISLNIGNEEMIPTNLYEKLIAYADNFYSKSYLDEEMPVEKIIENLRRFGEDKVETFLKWQKEFE